MDNNQLLMRSGVMETRPIYVEEWLDSLPYVDFKNTTQLLHSALKATNVVAMKANQRLELIELYNRPYQYYLDTKIRAGAQHTLQSIENMQSQVSHMKLLSIELARASRQTVDDALSQKSLWGQNKHPLQAVLMAINYLSQTLIFNFLEYAPTPAKVWLELNSLYQYTENIEQQNTPVKPVGTGKKTTTIDRAYKRIALIALADPYHLPFGAIWEIHEQIEELADLTFIGSFREVTDPNSVFVINLANDKGPLPYIKFNRANASANHRLFITEKLVATIGHNGQLEKTSNGISSGLVLSDYYAEHLLDIITRAWGMPPKRYFPRKAKTGRMELAHGINSIFYFLNQENEFQENGHDNNGEIITNEPGIPAQTVKHDYKKEQWQLVDTSGGGFAVTLDGKPRNTLRVGDLIGMSLDQENYPSETFRVGVLRWLLVRQGTSYKAGIQLINQQIYPASVRATNGNLNENTRRRAILAGRPGKQKEIPVITSKGLYGADKLLEIDYRDRKYSCSIVNRVESTTCFDHFTVRIDAVH